jgi:MoxR-like ATPase
LSSRSSSVGDVQATRFESIDEVEAALSAKAYLADRGLATAIYLATSMDRPMLFEGEPGVGKTEIAKTLARIQGAELIRLQCYEGIDASQVLYEWDYARQLLHARALQDGSMPIGDRSAQLFGPEFLLERPLLRAIRAGRSAVLLIDELDRADDEFEAFLLEILSDFSVSIPELGTSIQAVEPPTVVITSNRTRELHDALKRRCLFHWIGFPSIEQETEIIRLRAPGISDALADSVARAVAEVRGLDLVKRPGASEAIDWARALALLGAELVTWDTASASLGWLVKEREDLVTVQNALPPLLDA